MSLSQKAFEAKTEGLCDLMEAHFFLYGRCVQCADWLNEGDSPVISAALPMHLPSDSAKPSLPGWEKLPWGPEVKGLLSHSSPFCGSPHSAFLCLDGISQTETH